MKRASRLAMLAHTNAFHLLTKRNIKYVTPMSPS